MPSLDFALHVHVSIGHVESAGERRGNGGRVTADSRGLGDDGQIEIDDLIVVRFEHLERLIEEVHRVGPGVPVVVIRKMRSDTPEPSGTKQSIDHGVSRGVRRRSDLEARVSPES